MIEVNKYQTPLTDELLDTLPDEVRDQLFDIINNVEFVKRLISPSRGYAKDRPRDESGKIIVDLANPHILENMDYFRPTALHYEKYGTLTNLRPNANPNSAYGKWVREEKRRCWEGYVRESDGEWVTGYMYWFLNYSPIMLSKIREYKDKNGKKRKSKRADRIEALPECWEGIYWRFHCMDQASNGGIYNNFQGGQHMAELASRGKGKSYSLASILNHIFVLGENEEAHEKVKGIVTAYQKEYLTKDGVLNKFVDMANFCASNTQFPRKRLKNSLQEMTWIMGYKDAELDIEKGTQNTVLGVSSKDDESKLRGKRAAKILIEEFGTFPRLTDLYNVLLPSVQEGDIVFGQIYMLGTAGDNESDFAGAQEIMYNPKGYNMYALPNVFDKFNQGRPYFVFFFPGYINRKGCYNHDGVSDVIKALIEILLNRYRVKYNSTDPNTIIKTIAEVPITPAEAIVKTGVNMFPVADLTERLGQLDSNPREYDDVYTGDLTLNDSGIVEFRPTSDMPIREFPHKDNKIEGAFEIFQMPEIDKRTGKAYNARYILGCDPYDDDESNTMSLGSVWVLDLWTDKIVAEYTGRPPFADDFFEKVRRLCLFYNGRMNYENNKKGLFAYFSRMNCTYLLTDQLEFLKDKQMIKDTGYGNKAKGTNATEAINAFARNRLRAWLLKPTTVIQVVDGEETEVDIPNLFTLRSRAFIKELINYNSEGNFDRISAAGMLMLLREDRIILYQGKVSKEKQEAANSSYLGNDPFFKRNYKQ
nr:MAG TPA: Terminase large subunit [Crassvirales sp.]